MDSPRHVMDAPIKGELSIFLGFRFAFLGRDLLPCLVFLLFALVRRVLLVLRGPFLTSVLALFASPGDLRQLGVQLELPFELLDLGCHGDDLVVVRGSGAPLLFVD